MTDNREAGGLRRSPFNTLSNQEIEHLKREIKAIQAEESVFVLAIKTTSDVKKYMATHEEVHEIEQQLIDCGKSNKPYDNIICPKCGEQIIFTEYGNSYTVKCTTFNCIDYGVRGL